MGRATEQQSPVAIPASAAVHHSGLATQYGVVTGRLADDPHVVRIDIPPGRTALLGGTPYVLRQFHFHGPPEHRLPGTAGELELHLVHEAAGDRIAVIGVVLVPGSANPALEAVTRALGSGSDTDATVDPGDLLPDDLRHIAYTGSLTTPPYTTGVRWRVCLQPVEGSTAQLDAIKSARKPNARELQALVMRSFE